MRIGDFYGKVEFEDVVLPARIRHDAKWVVRRAYQPLLNSTSIADALLPDAEAFPMQPGKEIWITNNGDPNSGPWNRFEIRDTNQPAVPSTAQLLATIDYGETAVVMLGGDNRWRLMRVFTSVEFTALSDGFSETYTVSVASNRQNIDVDAEISAMGWDGQTDVFVDLIVKSGATIGSKSVYEPAVRASLTGANSRVFILVESGGAITGAGGAGGRGGIGGISFPSNGTSGEPGGTAIYADTKLTVSNFGEIGGGGGGGGGADGTTVAGGGGGGGGAGWTSGQGGAGFGAPPATSGTGTQGGNGGTPPFSGLIGIGGNGGGRGQAGSNPSVGVATGGAAGRWVEYRDFGLPGSEQPFIYSTGGQFFGGTGLIT